MNKYFWFKIPNASNVSGIVFKVIILAATKNQSRTGPASLDYIFKHLIEESSPEAWLFLN